MTDWRGGAGRETGGKEKSPVCDTKGKGEECFTQPVSCEETMKSKGAGTDL